jgi:hypothetical protein
VATAVPAGSALVAAIATKFSQGRDTFLPIRGGVTSELLPSQSPEVFSSTNLHLNLHAGGGIRVPGLDTTELLAVGGSGLFLKESQTSAQHWNKQVRDPMAV